MRLLKIPDAPSTWVLRNKFPILSLQEVVGLDVWGSLEHWYAREIRAKEESKAKAREKNSTTSSTTTPSLAAMSSKTKLESSQVSVGGASGQVEASSGQLRPG